MSTCGRGAYLADPHEAIVTLRIEAKIGRHVFYVLVRPAVMGVGRQPGWLRDGRRGLELEGRARSGLAHRAFAGARGGRLAQRRRLCRAGQLGLARGRLGSRSARTLLISRFRAAVNGLQQLKSLVQLVVRRNDAVLLAGHEALEAGEEALLPAPLPVIALLTLLLLWGLRGLAGALRQDLLVVLLLQARRLVGNRAAFALRVNLAQLVLQVAHLRLQHLLLVLLVEWVVAAGLPCPPVPVVHVPLNARARLRDAATSGRMRRCRTWSSTWSSQNAGSGAHRDSSAIHMRWAS